MPPADRLAAPYPPRPFHEARREVLTQFIRANPFGWLVSGRDGLNACGAPFVLIETAGGVELHGHLARANPQAAENGVAALVLFAGPHAYVRPGWYETKKRDGRAVPTWDYIAVQAKGMITLHDDPAWLHDHLEALSAQREGRFADPWRPADAPADYMERMVRGVIGVSVAVAELDGVWKLHQNHPEENRRGVEDGLRALGDPGSLAVARAIAELEAGRT